MTHITEEEQEIIDRFISDYDNDPGKYDELDAQNEDDGLLKTPIRDFLLQAGVKDEKKLEKMYGIIFDRLGLENDWD